MPRYRVAHINEQGIDLIIVPLDRQFGSLSNDDQDAEIRALQLGAHGAGLKGFVVPVWDGDSGRMAFRAPPQWHPYFRSINLSFVLANVNREIFW